ncbi:MAG: polyhydroxyalkanoic acid system family protein [Thermomicrobiales bacterium]
MPKTTVDIPHSLGKDEALGRIKHLLEDMKERHGNQINDLQENWTADGGTFSFKAMGFKIAGKMHVTDTDVRIDGEFPWAAKPFQGQIEGAIRDRAAKLLA